MRRRQAFVAAAFALAPFPAAADATKSAMLPMIRPATSDDLTAMVALLIQDAEQRRSWDALLWRIAADAPVRIGKAVDAALNEPAAREFWFVADHAGQIVGVAHAVMVPVPPIYDGAAGPPGLLLDDCFTSADAPAGTAEGLLIATEAALRKAGAPTLIASCPAAGLLRPLYERQGYQPVTLYLSKHRFSSEGLSDAVRGPTTDDIPGIVQLSARHRRTLAELSSRFWRIHPDADRRFDAWMRRSLTMKDRDMIVAGAPGEVRGYIIAQPCSPLLLPVAHETAPLGVIDDFYDADFANVGAVANRGSSGEALLAAAENAFARRGVDSTLVVCPAAWSSKVSVLERRGYRTAKIWMLKH